jgi:alkylhydroperoxidase/carboxymuconolactone decarboxylase family protein YurZ
MRDIPARFVQFTDDYPEIARAYDQLGAACHLAGPLPRKERALIKLGISMGAWLEGAVHSHVRKALEAGATPQEIRHAALLALPTIGFPSTMAVLTWIDDVLEVPGKRARAPRRGKGGPRRRKG